jgi:hypothetical protein
MPTASATGYLCVFAGVAAGGRVRQDFPVERAGTTGERDARACALGGLCEQLFRLVISESFRVTA